MALSVSLSNAVERSSLIFDNFVVTHPKTWTEHIWHGIQNGYELLILSPLARLYLHGPSFGGIGFWNGISIYTICSQKTTLLPEFWKSHSTECIQLISKHFYGGVVLFETVTYFVFIWVSLKYILNYLKHKCCKQEQEPPVHRSATLNLNPLDSSENEENVDKTSNTNVLDSISVRHAKTTITKRKTPRHAIN